MCDLTCNVTAHVFQDYDNALTNGQSRFPDDWCLLSSPDIRFEIFANKAKRAGPVPGA